MLEPQDGAHLLAGRWIEVGDAVDAAPHEDSVHGDRRERDVVFADEDRGDAGGAELRGSVDLLYQVFDVGVGSCRRASRRGGSVDQSVGAVELPARVSLRQAPA